ncbi:MAG: spore germination protein [Faecalibacterium sp.]|nr:spore germination protein [Faecalibacterium sp.]
MKQPLYTQLSENLAAFKAMFGTSTDFYTRQIRICGKDGAILMFEGLGSLNTLWNIFLEAVARNIPFGGEDVSALSGEQIVQQLLYASDLPSDNTPVEDFEMAVTKLTAGMALILVDGSCKAIALSVQDMKFRSVDTPASEGNLRGSREGFCDLLRINVTLLRRMIRTTGLVIEIRQSPSQNKAEYALCYDKTKAPPDMVDQIKAALQQAQPAFLLDSSYYSPWLSPAKQRLFTPVGYTERPAVASAKICEGKVVVLVNGSPSAMILPYLFAENFDCLDDYGGTAYFASFIRLLKYLSFYLTVFLPGMFVAAAVYTPELIPPAILYKVAAAEKATPLPLFAEMLLVIALLEMIREAGLRMPQSLGHSVSLVAALIIGDAAISTGILSTPCIIVASVTSIAMFLTPSLYEPATILRMLFLLAGGLAGPAGIAFGVVALVLHLSQLQLYGVYYTAEVLPFSRMAFRDGVIRRNYRRLSRQPYTIKEDRHES